MTRALSTVIFLLLALCRCNAAGEPNLDEAKANWASLLVAIAAKDQTSAQTFVGKTVCADGWKQTDQPPLRLASQLPDKRKLAIGITDRFLTVSAEREINETLNLMKQTASTTVRVIGVLHSVDVNKPEILIDPISARVLRGF